MSLAVGVGVVVAGCGDGGSGSDLAQQTPAAILAATRAALATVHTLHMRGTFQQAQGDVSIDVSVQLPGAVSFSFAESTLHGQVVAVGGRLYVKGDKGFWSAAGAGGKAAKLADRWLLLPQGGSSLSPILDIADPTKLADCVIGDVGGALQKQGTTKVAGRDVVVLVAQGGAPGTAPGRLYVAAQGAPLPLRYQQTGPTAAGGSHVCQGGGFTTNTGQTRSGSVDFLAWNGDVRIAAPQGAVDVGSLAG